MKRFFVSIITVCCLISTISAGSLLFTPHHVSLEAQIQANSILDKGIGLTAPFHVDAEGKRESTTVSDVSFLKLKLSNPSLVFLHGNIFDDLNLDQHIDGILSHFPFENFKVQHRRTILFPFHSFW